MLRIGSLTAVILYCLCTSVLASKPKSYQDVQKYYAPAEVWVAFAVGSSSVHKGSGKVRVFVSKSTTKGHAEWKAKYACMGKAFHCKTVTSLTTKDVCVSVVAGITSLGRYVFFRGYDASRLERACVERLNARMCSESTSLCD